jgi:DNA (cytosine-5)-methyltransferase 1
MRYLSVCSGIEAATVAWHDLGWMPVGFSEIEPFPSAVLAHHYPNVPNYGDMTKFEEWPIEPETVDLLVGGTPCQSFSVAGLRKGISDPRGGLMLTYLEIARRFRPRWIVWENVPGVLSSGRGRDFGSFLGALGELGYGWAYRVLDAQWVRTHGHPRAVPQRRRRVFVVGFLGDWKRAAQVLFERESVQRDPAKGRASRKAAPADAEAGVGAGCVTSHEVAPCLETTSNDYSRADGFTMVAGTLGNRGLRSHTELDGHGAYIPQPVPYDLFQITAPVNRQNRQPGDPCHTLARDNAAHAAVAHAVDVYNQTIDGDCAATLTEACGWTNTSGPKVMAHAMTVRRLTPRECERLQGFPDDYTAIPWRKKPADECPDGPRYKALGNSMAVNCMAWIGERIHALNCEHDQ